MSYHWSTAVHESGHVTLGLLLGLLVRSATVNANHSGLTQIFGPPWPLCVTSWGGFVAEKFVLPPEEVHESRSRIDRQHAHERAGRFVEWSEAKHVVRALGPPPEPAVRVDAPALDAADRADVSALVAEIGEKLRPRREARVLRVVALAERKARERLSRNLVVVRTIATALAGYGFLDGEQLLELFHEGRERQRLDDLEYGKGTTP